MKKVFAMCMMMILTVSMFAGEITSYSPVIINSTNQIQQPNNSDGLLYAQTVLMPSTASGFACQLDSLYPLDADIADDIYPAVTWQIDTIISWWSCWNGFTSPTHVPNVHILVYTDAGAIPAVTATQEIVVEAANCTWVGSNPYVLTLDLTAAPLIIPAGDWWFEVQPSNVFTVNGQTGWQHEVGIGNGVEVFFRCPLLGYPTWTTATTVGWTPGVEAGFELYGTEAIAGIYWDFEDGPQGWTHTGSAFPLGWGVVSTGYMVSSYTVGPPNSGDSCMCIEDRSSAVTSDTVMSPVFYGFKGDYLRWDGNYENFASQDSVEVLIREATGGTWGVWQQVALYTSDLHQFSDSVATAGYTGDSFQFAMFYDDKGYNNCWFMAFDNVGPVDTIILAVEEQPIEIVQNFQVSLLTSSVFSNNVAIQYALPVSSEVSFRVFDLSGREVRGDNFSISAGTHTINWNCVDNNNNKVSSGTYFYCLEAGENRATGKLIIAR